MKNLATLSFTLLLLGACSNAGHLPADFDTLKLSYSVGYAPAEHWFSVSMTIDMKTNQILARSLNHEGTVQCESSRALTESETEELRAVVGTVTFEAYGGPIPTDGPGRGIRIDNTWYSLNPYGDLILTGNKCDLIDFLETLLLDVQEGASCSRFTALFYCQEG